MSSVQEAAKFFSENYYNYQVPGAKLGAKALRMAQLIAKSGASKDVVSLPLAVRAIVVQLKPTLSTNEELFSEELAGAVMEQGELDPQLIQACVDRLCVWKAEGSLLEIHGQEFRTQKALERLIRGIGEQRCQKVTQLDLSKCRRIEKLDAVLRAFTQVEVLSLKASYGIKSLQGIELLAKTLCALDASGLSTLKDISALKACNQLTALNLSGASVLQEFDALESLDQLETLKLNGCSSCMRGYGLTSLSQALTKIRGLKELYLVDVSYESEDAVRKKLCLAPSSKLFLRQGVKL